MFWAAIFNFHGNFSQKVRNYHVTTLRMPIKRLKREVLVEKH
jgi:hypothetical protein